MTTIPGFTRSRIPLPDVTLSVQIAGDGPPLILLHGFPENGLCWAKVAPAFTATHRVIIPDLRGYGQSDAPTDDATHDRYSKRTMARDMTALMDRLGLSTSAILGHDRGARVAYRLALDHPARVTRLGIIEIAPTAEYWDAWGYDLAMSAWHWTFLAQPAPVPERMIASDPIAWLDHTLRGWTLSKSLGVFAPDALDSYRAQATDPARIHAMCADYRAGATTDRAHDLADRAAGRRIKAPLHFLWGHHGFPARTGDPAAIWRRWADTVTDTSCDSGHFVMEENPQAVLSTYLPFFRS